MVEVLHLVAFSTPTRFAVWLGIVPIGQDKKAGAARAIMTSTTKLRDGTRLVYDIHGRDDGRPRVVLIHSLGMDRFFWERVMPLLADSSTTLTYDCRGH